MTNKELLQGIEHLRTTMIAVSTGGQRIQEVNNEYRQLYQEVNIELEERELENPNPYPDLWKWYGKWSSDIPGYQPRREFISDMYQTLIDQVNRIISNDGEVLFDEPTGWEKIDRQVKQIKHQLSTANNEEEYQAVGLYCREVLITLGQEIYDPEVHNSEDDIEISDTDAKRMIESYLNHIISGSSNYNLRRHAKAALSVANGLVHKRTATFRNAAFCSEATISVVNLIAILSGQRDKEKGQDESELMF